MYQHGTLTQIGYFRWLILCTNRARISDKLLSPHGIASLKSVPVTLPACWGRFAGRTGMQPYRHQLRRPAPRQPTAPGSQRHGPHRQTATDGEVCDLTCRQRTRQHALPPAPMAAWCHMSVGGPAASQRWSFLPIWFRGGPFCQQIGETWSLLPKIRKLGLVRWENKEKLWPCNWESKGDCTWGAKENGMLGLINFFGGIVCISYMCDTIRHLRVSP
jgi:hypothetical protein